MESRLFKVDILCAVFRLSTAAILEGSIAFLHCISHTMSLTRVQIFSGRYVQSHTII